MTAGPQVLALAPGTVPVQTEPWTTPDLLGYARAEESVDLYSVCVVASQILYLLSGRRYGVRTETLRPAAGQERCGWGGLPHTITASGPSASDWLALYRANIGAPDWLQLKSPVQQILEVKVDGSVLDPSDYQLYDNRTLMRMQSSSGVSRQWPIYQRLDLPDTEVGTFSVTYQFGQSVPEGGKMAAQVFATELARYVNKDGSALPDRVVTVSRQGVTHTVLDPSQFIKMGRTGLFLPDIWLGSVNPHGARRRPSISSPESIINARPT